MKYLALLILLAGCGVKNKNCPYAVSPSIRGNYGPIYLNFANAPVKYDVCIINAANVWNEALKEKHIQVSLSSPSPYEILWFDERPSDFTGSEQARAHIRYSDGVIFRGNIRVNGKDFDYSIGDPSFNQVDCESVMIHEMGHLLGLGHTENPESVMYTSLGNGVIRRELKKEELSFLSCIMND